MIANPLLQSAKSCSLDPTGSDSAELFCVHESDFFENLQVLRDCGEAYSERHSQPRNGRWAAGEPIEDGAARGVSQRVEQAIDFRIWRGRARCSLDSQ